MIRRFLPLVVALLLLASFASTAAAQTSGTPVITLNTQYILNGSGYVVLNETVTFDNNGTSSLQVPTVQVGMPDNFTSHSTGFVLSSAGHYSQTSSDNGTVTTFTISPTSPTLTAGSSSSVSLKAYLPVSAVSNMTATVAGNLSATVLLNPSFNMKVNTLDREVVVPLQGTVMGLPGGTDAYVYAPTPTFDLYSSQETNVTPSIETQNVTISETSQTAWQPVTVYSVLRTIIPSSNGVPQVEDLVTLRNLASYSITTLPVTLLASGVTNVTVLPAASTPTIDPTVVTLTNGALSISNFPYESQIQPGDNFTFAMLYSLPKSDFSTSGDTVTVNLPYTLPVQAIVQNYSVRISVPSGMHTAGETRYLVTNATDVTQGTISLQYTVSPGWAANQALPAATLIFAAVFIVLAFRRSQTVCSGRGRGGVRRAQ